MAGCLLEGETVLVLAGFAAHLGYLDPVAVVAIAAAAAFVGDQLLFWIGRRHGPALSRRYPFVRLQAARAERLVARWPHLVIVGVRFAYGMRIAGPMLIGAAAVPPARFAALNLVGALVWAVAFTATGWVFGATAQALIARIGRLQGGVLVVMLALITVWWIVRRRMR